MSVHPQTLLPDTTITVEDARRTLTSLHRTSASLSDTEHAVLGVAEGLLRLLDDVRETDEEAALRQQVQIDSPGLESIDVYSDGVELVGEARVDQGQPQPDTSLAFVPGVFSARKVAALVGPDVSVHDLRRTEIDDLYVRAEATEGPAVVGVSPDTSAGG